MAEIPEGLQTDFSREALGQDYLRALYDYWCAARGGAELPPAGAIDPMRLPRSCLPYVTVLDVEPAPFRLHCRLVGTAAVEQFGSDMTGRYLDTLPGTAVQLARMAWCVRERRPYLAEGVISFAPNDFKRYQIIVLPFAAADGSVAKLMGGFHFHEEKKPAGSRLR